MLSALFKRPAPKMEDLLNGKESFEEIMGDIKDAKNSAENLRNQLDSIQLNDDPETIDQINKKLALITKETNRFQRIVQAPDQKPHFWEYILHPGEIRRTSRDQISTVARDDRRLQASQIRDDLNLAYENAKVMSDISKDLEVDPDFQLKSFAAKGNIKKKIEDVQRYLDIMIDSFDQTINDMANTEKAYPGNKNNMTQKKVKADYSEKATIEAAVKYYRAMRSTMAEEEVSQKIFGIGGHDDDPDSTITDQDIQGLVDEGMPTSAPQDSIYGTVSEWKPEYIDTMANELNDVNQQATEFVNSYDPNGDPSEQQDTAMDIYGNAQDLMRQANQYHQNGSIPDGVYSTVVDGLGPVMQNIPQFTSDGAYYGDMSTAGAYNSYASRSLTLARKNWEAPLPIKSGVNPKILKQKFQSALAKGKQIVSKLRGDKKRVVEVKKKADKHKKKKSQI